MKCGHAKNILPKKRYCSFSRYYWVGSARSGQRKVVRPTSCFARITGTPWTQRTFCTVIYGFKCHCRFRVDLNLPALDLFLSKDFANDEVLAKTRPSQYEMAWRGKSTADYEDFHEADYERSEVNHFSILLLIQFHQKRKVSVKSAT